MGMGHFHIEVHDQAMGRVHFTEQPSHYICVDLCCEVRVHGEVRGSEPECSGNKTHGAHRFAHAHTIAVQQPPV
jgi:hypothetical protein